MSDYRERQAKALEDPRVQAVREHDLVGRGSCTSIDEAWEHTELVEAFDRGDIKTPEAAVRWALEQEGLWREKGADASSGELDCPLIVAYNDLLEEIYG